MRRRSSGPPPMVFVKLLRGPAASFLMLLLLLGAANGWREPAAPAGTSFGPYFLAEGVKALFEDDAAASVILRIAILATGGALLQSLVFSWTANRIVSFLTAALFVLHPVAGSVLRGRDALVHLLGMAFVFGVLRFREHAWKAARRSLPSFRFEVLAFAMFLAAGFSGPEALAVPALILIVDWTFHGREQGPARREALPVAVAYAIFAVGVWHLADPRDATFGAPSVPMPESFSHWFFLDFLDLPRAGNLALVWIVGLLAFGALAYGLWSLRTHPKWLLIHGGFGLTWAFTAELPRFMGVLPPDVVTPLTGAALGLLPTSLAWRVILGAHPEPKLMPVMPAPGAPVVETRPARVEALEESHSESALTMARPGPASVPAKSPAALEEAEPSFAHPGGTERLPGIGELREAVEAAVTTAVEAAVGSVLRALAREGMGESGGALPTNSAHAQAFDRLSSASNRWADKAHHVLGEAWNDAASLESVFRAHCLPYLTRSARVLEIGPGGGGFTGLIAPNVAEVVCLGSEIPRLLQLRNDLRCHSNLRLIAGTATHSVPLAAGSVDFVFASDALIGCSTEVLFRSFRDWWRLLRPGGHAVLGVANLLDPAVFVEFQQRALDPTSTTPSGSAHTYVTPEIVRALASVAGFEVEGLHLGVKERDMMVVLVRELYP